jgi:hypothetical protein
MALVVLSSGAAQLLLARLRGAGKKFQIGGRFLSISPLPTRDTGDAIHRRPAHSWQTRHKEDVMAKFLYLFSGGEMADTPEAQAEQMQEWVAWFGSLGDSVVDMGNAFGASSTVTNGSASDGGASKLGGYSIINAESLGEATKKADGCPALRSGGSVEVYEALPM